MNLIQNKKKHEYSANVLYRNMCDVISYKSVNMLLQF